MGIRALVALTRGSERLLSRQVDPTLPGFWRYLVRHVTQTLDELEGRHLRHTWSALLAVGLARLGVVGDRGGDAARPGLSRSAATGVLDTTRLPHRSHPARPAARPAAAGGGIPRACARAPLAWGGGP